MTSIEHILLPTDLSPESQRAFAPVADLARRLGARVTLMHVVHDQAGIVHAATATMPAVKISPEEHAEAARRQLAALARELGEDLEVVADVAVDTGVADTILRRAEAHGVGLIAMATHGRSGIRRVLLGSTAEDVLRRSSVPVLLFPPRD